MYTLKTRGGDTLALRPELTAPIMRAYFENGLQAEPQPVLLYAYGPVFRHDKPQRGRWREFRQFDLEVIGSHKSVLDVVIIKVTLLILEEAGLTNLRLLINSIGDKDCRPAWRRDLVAYYRKHARELCDDCRERLKTNPLRLLDCKNPGCQALKAEAPAAVGYLCPACKQHFKEVLEHLDAAGLEYELDNTLVRGLDYYSRTVFEIVDSPGEGPEGQAETLSLAGGGRYDYLARAMGHKKDVPAVGSAIGLERVRLARGYTPTEPRLIKKPKIFFIQLGLEAKMKSLGVIEILRQAKVPIAQSLSRDSLAAQLAMAEKQRVPYALIFGQKEAWENAVIVRDLATRSQDTVPIGDLPDYLKKMGHRGSL